MQELRSQVSLRLYAALHAALLTISTLRSVSTLFTVSFTLKPSYDVASDFGCRVHTANKVARTHERVTLTDEKETSMCDICQVRPQPSSVSL